MEGKVFNRGCKEGPWEQGNVEVMSLNELSDRILSEDKVENIIDHICRDTCLGE